MKKLIVAAAGLMLAGTMVSTASAEPGVSFTGDGRARAFYFQDYNFVDSDTSNWNSRVRLKIKAESKGGAYAVARLRMAEAKWDGTQLTRKGGEQSNLFTDYAYVGTPIGPVAIEGGLSDVGDLRPRGNGQPLGLFARCHHVDAAIDATGGAHHLGVAVVADDDHLMAHGVVFLHHAMDGGDQRAGGVDPPQAEGGGLLLHLARHAMGAEDAYPATGNLFEVLDEDRPVVFQRGEDMLVVDDLVQHIDRATVALQAEPDRGDSPFHPCAETARGGEENGKFVVHGCSLLIAAV